MCSFNTSRKYANKRSLQEVMKTTANLTIVRFTRKSWMCCPDLSVPSHWKHLFFKGCTNFDKKYCRVAMRFTNISNQINVRVNNTFITWYVIISLSVPASPHTVPCLCSASMLPPLDTQRRVVASLPCSVLLRYIYKGESPLHYHAPLLCSTRTQHRVPLFFLL